ncbi:hypothetical protein J4230_03995 [Candidatus Woesearchaeota archaeon]|nr:hypothetical protein [Candidatus Woesearchaeota archaeon]
MKTLVFDTSSVISIVANDLLWVLKPLKQIFRGEFYIPNSVKFELIDKPFTTKMFKLESIMINKSITEGDFLVNNPLNVDDLLIHINSIYSVKEKILHIVDRGEVEALALVLRVQAAAYVVDERTMRLLIENPYTLRRILERKLHIKVDINKKLLKEFSEIVKGVKVIRSTELLIIAYEKGLLNKFVTVGSTEIDLLDGLLWGLKLRGCSISSDEISEITKFESKDH